MDAGFVQSTQLHFGLAVSCGRRIRCLVNRGRFDAPPVPDALCTGPEGRFGGQERVTIVTWCLSVVVSQQRLKVGVMFRATCTDFVVLSMAVFVTV